ncbi:hypothetical protein QQF64_011924 [Cirrhinus molitorella]|uniref:Uncharacterized protein n=1 Tax=Cirrhinus molitorella TaxID=172907 RepID=A0ABR3LXG5_9TELE
MHRGPPGSALTLSRPKAHQITEYVAARQTRADNISKEILQYRIVNANCLNVYSNQEQHTSFWQGAREECWHRSSWDRAF